MKHLIEVERLSACGTWVERFFVEVHAATEEHARACVEFSLQDSERALGTAVG
jgi:hypothetical protein